MDVKLEGEDTFLLTYSDSNPDSASAVVIDGRALHEAPCRAPGENRQRHRANSALTRSQRSAGDGSSRTAVRDFKFKHYGALPEQQEANLRVLDQATMEVNIQSTNLDMDRSAARTPVVGDVAAPSSRGDAAGRALRLAHQVHVDNPEVKKIQAQYESVHAQRIEDEKGLNDKVRRNNPELAALEGEIGRTKAMLSGLRSRQVDVRGRVDATARNGQELAGLSRPTTGSRRSTT